MHKAKTLAVHILVLSWTILFVGFQASAETLPAQRRQAFLQATLGLDPCVKISSPEQSKSDSAKEWVIRVTACSEDQAAALALVLEPAVDAATKVEVLTPAGELAHAPSLPQASPERRAFFVAMKFEEAFLGNPAFSRAVNLLPSEHSVARVRVNFKPGLLQVKNLTSGKWVEVTAPSAFAKVAKRRFEGLPPTGITAYFAYDL